MAQISVVSMKISSSDVSGIFFRELAAFLNVPNDLENKLSYKLGSMVNTPWV